MMFFLFMQIISGVFCDFLRSGMSGMRVECKLCVWVDGGVGVCDVDVKKFWNFKSLKN